MTDHAQHVVPPTTETHEPAPVREIRVHGVGGAQHARMLGVSSDAHVVIVDKLPSGTTIVRRKRVIDDQVVGFSWGELTSGSAPKALWVLLLPLSFANLAGWGVAGKYPRAQRFVVHVLAGIATLATCSGSRTCGSIFSHPSGADACVALVLFRQAESASTLF